jgi:hypothetical protein
MFFMLRRKVLFLRVRHLLGKDGQGYEPFHEIAPFALIHSIAARTRPSIGHDVLIAFLLPGAPLDAQYPNNLPQ